MADHQRQEAHADEDEEDTYSRHSSEPAARKRPAPRRDSTDRELDTSTRANSSKQRSKRSRYVTIACNECKRRKIKCNGQTPCERCGHMQLDCVYASNTPSTDIKDAPSVSLACDGENTRLMIAKREFKEMAAQVARLQDQVDYLYNALNSLRMLVGQDKLQELPVEISASRRQAASRSDSSQPPYMPTPGSGSDGPHVATGPQNRPMTLFWPHDMTFNSEREALHPDKDPIWGVKQPEALRLLDVYEETIGTLYAIVDVPKMRRHVATLFAFIDAAWRTGLVRGVMHGADALTDPDTEVLKLCIALASFADNNGETTLSRAMFSCVGKSDGDRQTSAPTIAHVRITTLQSIYYFHSDQEKLACRAIGAACRLSLTLNMNQHRSYWPQSPLLADGDSPYLAKSLFWAMYNIDHRLATNQGVAFAMPSSEIDIRLRDDLQFDPFLTSMTKTTEASVKLSQIFIDFGRDGTVPCDLQPELDALESYVSQRHRYIHPDTPQWQEYFEKHNEDINTVDSNSGEQRQKLLLYLRIRAVNLGWRRFLLVMSSSQHSLCIRGQFEKPETASALANVLFHVHDMIGALHYLVRSGGMDRINQILFSSFIPSTVATSLMPYLMYPNMFQQPCRPIRKLALEIVRAFVGNGASLTRKRLRQTLQSLQAATQSSTTGILTDNQDTAIALQELSQWSTEPEQSAARSNASQPTAAEANNEGRADLAQMLSLLQPSSSNSSSETGSAATSPAEGHPMSLRDML